MSDNLETKETAPTPPAASPVAGQSNGLGIAALVLGIVGVVLVFVPFLPWVTGILAIIFGLIGNKKPTGKGMALTGFILGIVTVGLKVWFWISVASILGGV